MEEKEKLDVNKDVKKDVKETTPSAAEGAADADEAEKINVCSDKFDPLVALYSPTVPLPFPNIKCFNNVAEYVSFHQGGRGRAKPENVEKKLLQKMKGVADPERLQRLQRLMVNNPVKGSEEGESSGSSQAAGRKKHKPRKTVLTRMSSCKGSPLGELYRCVEERIRVKVHIRTFKGLRGVCSGFVVAFDKFWNMAMVDVDETYREPLLGEALYHEKALTITRLFEKLKLQEKSAAEEETAGKQQQQQQRSHLAGQRQPGKAESKLSDTVKTRLDTHGASLKARAPDNCPKKKTDCQAYGKVHTRHVNQLFIRGENVILVNPQPL